MKAFLLTLLLCVSIFFAHAQSDSTKLAGIASKLEKNTSSNPVEKVYLHLNKPGYNTTDTIWFKAYVTAGPHHQPSALSGIVYVDLINDKDKIVKSIKLKNTGGAAAGDFTIDATTPAGQYRIRAYTTWMRNAGTDYFFSKIIDIKPVKNLPVYIESAVKTTPDNKTSAELTYVDKFGRPLDRKAVSYEIKSDTIVVFKGGGITDDKGVLVIPFADQLKQQQKGLNIASHVVIATNTVANKTIAINLKNTRPDVQFFPEGGALVNGIRSKIAFKAVGTNGLGVNLKGTVVDNDNNEVAYFNTSHAGMGVFALMPQAGKSYTANIVLDDNSKFTLPLPTAADKGFVLSVNSTDSLNLSVKIAANEATLHDMGNSVFYLAAQSGGAVYYATLGKLNGPAFIASVPKNKFPSGIVQFTLFNADYQPLNQRLVFITNPADLLSLDIKGSQPLYKGKEKVNLTIEAKNNNKPVEGTFSISVYHEDIGMGNQNADATILSSLLLTSDIRGYIENPAYYFTNATDDTRASLDALMLTQGYSRFDWKDIMTDHLPVVTFQPEKSINISGSLATSAGKPVVGGKLKILSLTDKKVIDTLTDADGRFMLKNVDFTDSVKLVIQARKANDGRNVNITLDNRTIPNIYKINAAELAASDVAPYTQMRGGVIDTSAFTPDNTKIDQPIDPQTGAKQLKQVDIKASKQAVPNKYNGYGAKYQYDINMANASEVNSVSELIQYKNPLVYTRAGRLVDGSGNKRAGSPFGAVVVNGREYDIDFLDAYSPADVQSISISNGVIMITTKAYAGTDTVKVIPGGLKNVNLKQIDVKGRKNAGTALAPWQEAVAHSANRNGPGNANYVFTAKDLENCIDVAGCIINKLPGIKRVPDPIEPNLIHYYIERRSSQSMTGSLEIKFMLDGILLNQSTQLDAISVSDVSSVEVLNNNSYLSAYGTDAPGGLVLVTTKIGNEANSDAIAFKSVPGVIYTRFNGFYQPKAFYTPKYTPTGNKLADNRTVIYWNPDLVTDGKSALPIQYFNSDVKGSYRVVVEGIDNDGNIGRAVYKYRVE